MTRRSDHERLTDILDRIARIQCAETILRASEEQENTSAEGQVAFDAILYNLLVIGEAVKTLSPEFRRGQGANTWKDISGMRDILAHEYFRVDSTIVRATIDKPLRELKELCEIWIK